QLRNVQRFQFGKVHRLVLPAGKAGSRAVGVHGRLRTPQLWTTGWRRGLEEPWTGGGESTWESSRAGPRAPCAGRSGRHGRTHHRAAVIVPRIRGCCPERRKAATS